MMLIENSYGLGQRSIMSVRICVTLCTTSQPASCDESANELSVRCDSRCNSLHVPYLLLFKQVNVFD